MRADPPPTALEYGGAVRDLIEALCSDEFAGRAPGTEGGLKAGARVEQELKRAGLAVERQPIPACGGTNLLASVRGQGPHAERWVVVGAHYDHLGAHEGQVFRGADDNAAAVAILVEVARALAQRPPSGRSVLLCAFDAEEPPYFLSAAMGSEYWCAHPTVPLASIDLMVCMDLVGHAVGSAALPADVRNTVFVLGAEKSQGTGTRVDALARQVPGVIARRADAETIPPLSDYRSFWKRNVPFAFLTCGRWAHYHTPQDTPDRLDWPKLAAMAKWVEAFTRDACARGEESVPYTGARDDRSTLTTLVDLLNEMSTGQPALEAALKTARGLLSACDERGVSPTPDAVSRLLHALEANLA